MLFARDKHARYWRMCAQRLPDHYISNDSSRMTLGFFILSALDLLDILDTVDLQERKCWISWIYGCQVAQGGFRGFTGTDLRNRRDLHNGQWDPANVPATFFALASLLVLGDDLSRVKRQECLTWLPKLQREDGSFGELLSEQDSIEGDRDLRQCCCAAGIAYILQDPGQIEPAFDEGKLLHYIQSCQSQSGGFGASPYQEPHSGLSYCAVAALAFIERLRGRSSEQATRQILEVDQCIRWFLDRQTNVIEDNENDSEEGSNEDIDPSSHPSLSTGSGPSPHDTRIAGFNGRDGKIADTCYCFWNAGALAILGKKSLIDSDAMRQYLLEVTQHRIGGFGKGYGDPPDILHSYLGLAALGLFGQPEVKALDPTLCISLAAAARLDHVSWKINA